MLHSKHASQPVPLREGHIPFQQEFVETATFTRRETSRSALYENPVPQPVTLPRIIRSLCSYSILPNRYGNPNSGGPSQIAIRFGTHSARKKIPGSSACHTYVGTCRNPWFVNQRPTQFVMLPP